MTAHPPYVWFGGKRPIAAQAWAALGDVGNYVEPFFGGGSVFLLRPEWHTVGTETINDADGFVCNFWRAVRAKPEAVAEAMNWPVNEIDLEARHRELCRMPEKAEFLERMKHDADHYDVRRAAWWCWGLNAWIGGGWCGGEYVPGGVSKGAGVCDGANKRPHLGIAVGVHRKLPHVGTGRGVHRKLPHLGNPGTGVHRKLPHLGDAGRGERARRLGVLTAWMHALADRLRNVRVSCGDWARVCTNGACAHGDTVGVFLDPPYSGETGRDSDLYRQECLSVAHDCREWCESRTRETDPRWSCAKGGRFRVVLCGYEGEHEPLESLGWRVEAWKANGGFGNSGDGDGRENAHRERIWYSPSCEVPETSHTLFDGFG